MKENMDLIRKYTIGSEGKRPNVLILAGVHGDEYEPMLAAWDLLSELDGLLVKGSVTIIPVANEGAYLNGSRLGRDGLDLARICPGDKNGSETEKVAAEIGVLIAETDYVIDMHTGGLQYNIYPLVGYMLHPDSIVLAKQRDMAKASGLPLIWGTDHRSGGRTLSLARDQGVPAIYFEYGGGTGVREHVIKTYKEVCVRILASLGLFEASFSALDSYNYWLEDERTESGHLQTKMPAPADGIFTTTVKIGDHIRNGQLFGEIVDPLTKVKHKVLAGDDGLVFLLRTTVYIKEGDALGGILPVELFNKKIIKEI